MSAGRPAVFLDRDGTMLAERHYLADPERVELLPGAVEALADLAGAGFALVVVTNQSGIARGLYTEEGYHRVAERMLALLGARGVVLDDVRYCAHHPDFTGPCACRKPGTLLYREAATALGLDLGGSWFVGDKLTDVLPAVVLGGRGILVRTGYGREHENDVPPEVAVVDDLAEAAGVILAGRR